MERRGKGEERRVEQRKGEEWRGGFREEKSRGET